ncbi:hypothetical protein EW145_g2969 [Phellinidium pouzarii]|uniref:AAA-ATPase-like domain-containing protein n=1 Tax=Phellinidium pouzarii TaxID=167371 RepID=A0A4S4L908_9AGAM|nr:hypothetical protein EW145_g2969 [Phellinidium pouzarii]
MARDKKPKPATLRRSKKQMQEHVEQENQQEGQESDVPDFFVSLKDNISSALSNYQQRLESNTCVDKTNVIEAFLEESFPIHLLLRPRRCGKTTLLTMFQSFFEMGCPEDVQKRRTLFVDTPSLISKSAIFESDFAQYPVIYVDMSTVRGATFEAMLTNFELMVSLEYRRQHKLGYLESLDGFFYTYVQGVLDGTGKIGCQALSMLARSIHEKTKKRIILLIDEYDTPVVNSEIHGYFAETLEHFSEVYASLLKNSSTFIRGTVMAGILHIQQTGFLSGLNNLSVFALGEDTYIQNPYRLTEAYAKALLFTSEEVTALYNHYNAKRSYSYSLKDMKKWYGGYFACNGLELFNPWSVCRALEVGELKGYWIATGVDSLLKRHIDKSSSFPALLEKLLRGESVKHKSGESHVRIDARLEDNELLEIMNRSGYLMRRGSFLKIPNLELQANFFEWVSKPVKERIKERIQYASINKDSRALFDACVSAPPATFHDLFKNYLEKHGPAKFGHSEDKYHNYVFSALQHGSGERFAVRSETGGGHGRIDILIEEIGGTKAAILELKASRAKKPAMNSLETLARSAIKQIQDKKYRAGLDDEIVELREHGIAMHAKSCAIRTKIMKRDPRGVWSIADYRILLKLDTRIMDLSGGLDRVNVILKGDRFSSALSNFRQRAEECTLVDKTQAIAEFLSFRRPLHCVLRPRRSGKTTMLTMFQTFFEAGNTQDVYERRMLFKDLKLKIYDHSCFQLHFAQYTVLYVDFSNLCRSSTKRQFDTSFSFQLGCEINRHQKLGHFAQTEHEDFNSILNLAINNGDSEVKLENALFKLSQMLHDATGRKVLVLVDEYDTPVSSTKNPDMFSYVTHSDLDFSFEQMKLWYGSYLGAGRKLYNPWTIARAFESNNLKTYWNDSGPGDFLVDHFFSAGKQFQKSFSQILSGNSVRLTIRGRLYPISFGEFTPSDIFGLLAFAGYLTESAPNVYEIPNGEVRKEYTSWVRRHMRYYPELSKINSDISLVINAALAGPVTRFRSRFRKFFESENLATVRRRNVCGMNTVMVVGAFMAASDSVDPVLLRSSAPDIIALGFYKSSSTAAFMVLTAKSAATKASIQKASSILLSNTDFEALASQIPHEVSCWREFSVVICGSLCGVSGRTNSLS